MTEIEYREAIEAFLPGREVVRIGPHGNGHINDTFRLEIDGDGSGFILQRINTSVFKNPRGIIANHLKLQQAFQGRPEGIQIPALLPGRNGEYLFTDQQGGAWRVMDFIPGTHSIELVEALWQARQAGNAFGWFAGRCSQLDPAEFEEAIPDFHRLSFRLKQLLEAVENDHARRLEQVRKVVDFFLQRAGSLGRIEELTNSGEIPLRVVHNDTKINNLLFRERKAVAVIDLDTVGPGSLFYDYGDAIRTGANAAMEDERDSRKSALVPWAFEAYTRAYLDQVRSDTTPREREFFHLAPVLMTYIMGIRFLADYLNGDVYYKTAYADHNLVRAKVQLAFIESLESQASLMQDIIAESLR
jgi:Ser/Thr protein kinase RdoA (MazF antagonist)